MDRPGSNRERDTLTVLLRLLATDSALRDRLADVPRLERLCADLRRGCRRRVGETLHVRRSRVEVRTAMHSLGLVHAFDGRPIPGWDPVRDRHEAVEAVVSHITQNGYAKGVEIHQDEVVKQLENEYFSVPPWPFQALVG